MAESLGNAGRPVDNRNGKATMSRLVGRLMAMMPPPLKLATAQMTSLLRPSLAAAAPLATSAAMSARAAERARCSRSVVGLMVDGLHVARRADLDIFQSITSFTWSRNVKRGLVKTQLTVAIVWAVLAGTLTFVAASSIKREQATDADALPAYEIVTAVRLMGFNPITEPARRGPYYVLTAIDARGVEMHVVADAQVGEILSVVPTQASNTPRYERSPRIIHVPQPGERNDGGKDRASVGDRDEAAVTNDDGDDVAPLPHRRVMPAPPPMPRMTPRWPPRSEAPPPRPTTTSAPDARRAVLAAPPLQADGPTPIRPTPKFNAKGESGEKFGSSRATFSRPLPPPIGYSPPAALSPADDEADHPK